MAHTFNSLARDDKAILITHSNNRESCILASGSIFWRTPYNYHVTVKDGVTVVPLARVSEIVYGKNGPADGLLNCTTLQDDVLRQQITVAPAKVDLPLVLSVPVPPVNITNMFAGERPKGASDTSIKIPDPAPDIPRQKAIILPFFSEPVWHNAGPNKRYDRNEAYVSGFQSVGVTRGAPAIVALSEALKSCGNTGEIVKDVMGFASEKTFTPPVDGLTSDDLNLQVAEGRRHYVMQALGMEPAVRLAPPRNIQVRPIKPRFEKIAEMRTKRDEFFRSYLSAMWQGDEAFSRSVVLIIDAIALDNCELRLRSQAGRH